MRERKKSETEVEIEVDGMKELHVTLSPRTPAGDPPEPEELIKALMVRGQFWIGNVLLAKMEMSCQIYAQLLYHWGEHPWYLLEE